jgi:DNA-binding response OmpR family regulator
VVDAHISNLRKKLEEGGRPRLIHTVRGAGYALRVTGGES